MSDPDYRAEARSAAARASDARWAAAKPCPGCGSRAAWHLLGCLAAKSAGSDPREVVGTGSTTKRQERDQ